MTAHGSIIIHGARENNLKDVDLDIPKGRITVFTGVSGSGKSSIVFDTIAAESQRLLNETMPAFVQNFLPHYGQPSAGTSDRYSFNDPTGMCLTCEGIGWVAAVDEQALVDDDLSLNEGAIDFPNFAVESWYWKVFVDSGFFGPDMKVRDYTPELRYRLPYEPEMKMTLDLGSKTMNTRYEGLIPKLQRLYLSKELESLQKHIRTAVERISTQRECGACGGTRLNEAALATLVNGKNIAECTAMESRELATFIRTVDRPDLMEHPTSLTGRHLAMRHA